MIPKINSANKFNNVSQNTVYSTPPQISPSFGNALGSDTFMKAAAQKMSLEDAIAQIPKLFASTDINNPKNIPLSDDADIWGNLHNMAVNIEKLADSDNYLVSLSMNNPDGSTGFINIAHGPASKIKSNLETKEFVQKFKDKFEKFSWHFNDEPEIVDLNG